MCWKENDSFELEEHKVWGPNVISCRIITGGYSYYAVGCYIPPSETTLASFDTAIEAWNQCPQGFIPILMGDLNANINNPRNERDWRISEQIDSWDSDCLTGHYKSRRRRIARGNWTWRQRRLGRWISSKPDYAITTPRGRKRVRRVRIVWPRHHDSDHRAIILNLKRGNIRRLRKYRRQLQTFPLTPARPLTEPENVFEALKASVERPKPRELQSNGWISTETWDLIDRRAALRKYGSLTQRVERQLGRRIKQSLKSDRQERARKAGVEITDHLSNGELKDAWSVAKRWYRLASETAPKPCYHSLEKQTAERVDLYQNVVSPGDDIPIHVEPFEIRDDVPTEQMRKYG